MASSPHITVDYAHLGMGRGLDLPVLPAPGTRWRLLSLADRGASVQLPPGWISVWAVVKGHGAALTPFVEMNLRAGEQLAWSDGPMRLSTQRGGWIIGLAAPRELWRPGRTQGLPRRRMIFSRSQRADRDVVRLLVRLVRACQGGDEAGNPLLLQCLQDAVHDSQNDLDAWIERCSGQTRGRKEITLQRLLRARNVLVHSHGVVDGVAHLARTARFSVTHFKRTYRDVFGIAPGEHASKLRIEHTWQLVTSTTLTIADVCEAVGFESKSAFCRTFKQHFGLTTSQARGQTLSGAAAG